MPAPFLASRVYLKPLLPKDIAKGTDIEAVLKKAKTDLIRRLRGKLKQTVFSDRAKRALSKALSIEIKASSLQVIAKHPAFAPLVLGQRPGQMKWLMNARRPVPIITEEGKLIFRSATAKSMRDGKWLHPGRPPSTFVEKAKEESRTFLKEKFKKELRKKIRKSWGKGKKKRR
jgi:hypothetical protein